MYYAICEHCKTPIYSSDEVMAHNGYFYHVDCAEEFIEEDEDE